MYFGSDNSAGAAPRILEALTAANSGTERSYGHDNFSERARNRLREVFNHAEAQIFFVSTGTAANALTLAAMTPSYGAILCHSDAHINVDECGAPEFFTGGAKLISVPNDGGKMTAETLSTTLKNFPSDAPHNTPPKALSLSQSTESGLVYTPAELKTLSDIAHAAGMRVHMDGARFANAVVNLGCEPAELTWRAGIDAVCMGATKDGALGAEAIILFNQSLAQDFNYRVKRSGHLVSKSRWMGAQMEAWLNNDYWLDLARHANKQATVLAAALRSIPGVQILHEPQANAVFALLNSELHDRLQKAGAVYYEWPRQSLPLAYRNTSRVHARFVTSFRTTTEDIAELVIAATTKPSQSLSPAG